MRRQTFIAGIDEAGRGPLAGPISVGLVLAPRGFRFRHPTLGRIRDSKNMNERRREEWYRFLRDHPRLMCLHTFVSPRVIDRINIAHAANRAVLRLAQRCVPLPTRFDLDGSLALPERFPHRVLIKGDERKPLIAAASIIAKVWRDRYMACLAAQIPRYGFEIHKGYGTRAHRRALRRYGPSSVHRRSFLKWLAND